MGSNLPETGASVKWLDNNLDGRFDARELDLVTRGKDLDFLFLDNSKTFKYTE